MHTFGAIILALIGVILMQAILGLAASYLTNAISITTGIVWMPLLLNAAFNGCAVYGGLLFALKVARNGSPRTTFYVVQGIMLLSLAMGGIASIIKEERLPAAFVAGQVLHFLAGAIGGWIAIKTVIAENGQGNGAQGRN